MIRKHTVYNAADFDTWLEAVDAHVEALYGVGRDDLPDCLYRDWYDDGMNPRTAARKARAAAWE